MSDRHFVGAQHVERTALDPLAPRAAVGHALRAF